MLATRFLSLLLFVVMIGALLVLLIVVLQRQAKSKQKRKSGELPSAEGIRDLIAQQRLDDAVDLYQRFTGVDVYTALEAVREMAREMGIADTLAAEDVERQARLKE